MVHLTLYVELEKAIIASFNIKALLTTHNLCSYLQAGHGNQMKLEKVRTDINNSSLVRNCFGLHCRLNPKGVKGWLG